ncbi:hypothetical protein GGR56DRAFT_165472 [Xylariaceae sp. FL0804]|nr:hypothetical protein GGR56DRAFT_165472 [Xylariaceae sp. FL0804]
MHNDLANVTEWSERLRAGMTRTLPWKRREREGNNAGSRLTQAASNRHIKTEPRDDGPADNNHERPRHRESLIRSRRSASTSPPPEPLQEEFMIDGPDGDDRYRMVEDEFLATAQLFTAHLHAAEYQRLKAAARSRNADAAGAGAGVEIARPVVGAATDRTRRREERKALLASQRRALRQARAAESDDDQEEGRSSSLHGLMESPRKQAVRLDSLTAGTASTTRAAAGFQRRQRQGTTGSQPGSSQLPSRGGRRRGVADGDGDEDEDEDEDERHLRKKVKSNDEAMISGAARGDRSASRQPRAMPPPPKHRPRAEAERSSTTDSAPKPTALSTRQRREAVNEAAKATRRRRSPPEAAGESDSSDAAGAGLDFMSRLKKQQAERRRGREQRRQAETREQTAASSRDIIPNFL